MTRAMRLLFFVALIALTLPFAGCREQNPVDTNQVIRVCLSQNVQQLKLSASAPVGARAGDSATTLNFPNGAAVTVSLAQTGWHVGTAPFPYGELKLSPTRDGTVRVNGSAYRGEFRLVPTDANRFDLVNDVPLDSYLKGVLPGELPADWSIEAYKAQAITARTYALYERQTRPTGKSFDVFSDTRSQVYKGLDAETSKSRAATDETAGVVVAYAPPGESLHIFKAYFSSCCGGVGQSVYDAFGEAPIPPLTEQSVGGLCNASSRFSWPAMSLTKAELTRRIRAFGARRGRPEKDMAMLDRIDIASQNQFGRPVRFTLTDARGTRYNLSGEETRWACNADAASGPSPNITLWSSFFRPISDGDVIRFTDGHGFGHGVGLCQWCSEARAEQGMRHEDIVMLAFPKAKLVRAY